MLRGSAGLNSQFQPGLPQSPAGYDVSLKREMGCMTIDSICARSLALTLLAVGCGTDHTYDGPPIPLVGYVVVRSPSSTSLIPVGGSLQLALEGFSPTGTSRGMMSAGWSSSRPAIATVSGDGLVTGVALGQAYIRGSSKPGQTVLTDSVLVSVSGVAR